MSLIDKGYSPRDIEDKWYKFWEENNYFQTKLGEKNKKFSIVIPPPNVTGILHMGHVLNNTMQDILVRFKRMDGYNVSWMPGLDHAGIATENKVESRLLKQGLSKQDLGKEKFIEQVWSWKEEHGDIILQQFRKLGLSLDWENEKFTMDPDFQDAVLDVFIKLYEDNLIYKGEYIVNWCPRCLTAIADDEVEHIEKDGQIWKVRYPISDDSGDYIVVATTRPETIPGDTAVAVNPNDIRYASLIGKRVIVPIVNRLVPVIADSAIESGFGTGVLKVTPAHDIIDFEIGKRHNLESINVINPDGTMNENAGKFKNMDRFEARKLIVKQLEADGLIFSEEQLKHSVGHCYRCNTVIEPRVSKQWFVRMAPLAKEAIRVVEDGEIEFLPATWQKVYYNWMYNIRDWCISRQIWWGHRIPVFYCSKCSNMVVSKTVPAVCDECQSTLFVQDNDVLDTWFSSWIFPFAELGWPKETEHLKHLYPHDAVITGPDIIFFWVARMIMSGLYFTKEIPFKKVFLNGIVRDEIGRKMSKTLGNSPDPLDIISEYGADSLRFAVIHNNTYGQDVFYSEKWLETSKNFCNKLWNASKFYIINNKDSKRVSYQVSDLELPELWILSKYNRLVKDVRGSLENFKLSEAAKAIYQFVWFEFCDWYLELSKVALYGTDERRKEVVLSVLKDVLDGTLRLMHPFIPFITEEIWQNISGNLDEEKSIVISKFPIANTEFINENAESNISILIESIKAIRNIKVELNLPLSQKVKVLIKTNSSNYLKLINEMTVYIQKLANVSEIVTEPEGDELSSVRVVDGNELYVILDNVLDIDKERERIQKEIEKSSLELSKVLIRLENPGFVDRAPKEILERELRIKKELEDKLIILNENLSKYS